MEFQEKFVRQRAESAARMGKPLVAEEFGKAADRGRGEIGAVRDPFYESMYRLVEESVQLGGPLQGSLFWEWDPDETNDTSGEGRRREGAAAATRSSIPAAFEACLRLWCR